MACLAAGTGVPRPGVSARAAPHFLPGGSLWPGAMSSQLAQEHSFEYPGDLQDLCILSRHLLLPGSSPATSSGPGLPDSSSIVSMQAFTQPLGLFSGRRLGRQAPPVCFLSLKGHSPSLSDIQYLENISCILSGSCYFISAGYRCLRNVFPVLENGVSFHNDIALW